MKLFWLFVLVWVPLLAQDPESLTINNVNTRYMVESVELSRSITARLSRSLRQDLESLVGQHFDPQDVAAIASRIRKEIHVVVGHHVEKGLRPENVKIVFDARERRWDEDDARITKLAYHGKQGYTGGVQLGLDAGRNRFEVGVQSDADTLIERYAGFNIGYSYRLAENLRVQFQFESLHEMWNPATEAALLSRSDVPGIYRERQRLDPSLVILITPDLSLTAGLSFGRFQMQYPIARDESANAFTVTLRQRKVFNSADHGRQIVDAGYNVHAATGVLGSDYAYTRHEFDIRYSVLNGHHSVTIQGLGGFTGDRAPLYERFSLGDSRTLRGWNKFDVAPIGGTRCAYGSFQYTFRHAGAFYDTGSVWDQRKSARLRQAAGILLALNSDQQGPYLAVGFPLRSSEAAPLFILGMTF